MSAVDPRELLADPAQAGAYFIDARDARALADAAGELGYALARADFGDCRDKDDALRRIAVALRFPDWFGGNWDALNDSVNDLSWWPAPGYVLLIEHAGGWQSQHPDEAATLVEEGVATAEDVDTIVRTTFGFRIRAVGRAPQAARYAGFDANRTVWATLLLGGGLAGLAGVFEAAGTFGQMTPQFPVGYGFTAIIVAFLGRLHPLGIVLAGIVMAVTYIGGETAQTRLGLPDAAAGLFQAMTLFFLLATDVLVRYRIRFEGAKGAAA